MTNGIITITNTSEGNLGGRWRSENSSRAVTHEDESAKRAGRKAGA